MPALVAAVPLGCSVVLRACLCTIVLRLRAGTSVRVFLVNNLHNGGEGGHPPCLVQARTNAQSYVGIANKTFCHKM